MKEYDVIILGSGAGANLVEDAISHKKTIAFVDKGPLGGTCLNVGCIPTKLIGYPADRIMEIREAEKFGISAEIKNIDFASIMERMRNSVRLSHDHIKENVEEANDFDFLFGEARFIEDYVLEVNNQTIRGKTIFIATGARPLIPPLKGIESIEYLTNETALQLTKKPASIIIIGGGYIAAEFAHFFEAMGTQVTIIQRNRHLVPEEEPEISELLKTALSRRMVVHTNTNAVEIRQTGKITTVVAKEVASGRQLECMAEQVMIAAGRKSNADILQVKITGVQTNEDGYIIVDDHYETTKKNIWAFGDAIGKKMFRHTANHEASLAWNNAAHGKKSKLNYLTVPHAVFTWPEIASVGLTEGEAVRLMGKQDILVGKAMYTDVARGEAMMETEGFTKTIVHKKSGKILGYHIIGPQASILIQEVINTMASDGKLWSLANGIHIHPALSEVVLKVFGQLREVE